MSLQILAKVNSSDPSYQDTQEILHTIIQLCGADTPTVSLSLIDQYKAPILSTVALAVLSYVYWYTA